MKVWDAIWELPWGISRCRMASIQYLFWVISIYHSIIYGFVSKWISLNKYALGPRMWQMKFCTFFTHRWRNIHDLRGQSNGARSLNLSATVSFCEIQTNHQMLTPKVAEINDYIKSMDATFLDLSIYTSELILCSTITVVYILSLGT